MMKNIFKILMILTIALGSYSCNSDDDNLADANAQTNQNTLLFKKWNVTNNAGTSSRTSDLQANSQGAADLSTIESIEFLASGDYVLWYNDGTIVEGKYSFTTTDEITLENVGTITTVELTENTYRFSITISDNTLELYTEAAEEIVTQTDKTALFRKWVVESIDYIEEQDIIDNTGDNDEGEVTEVLFSPYGTYLSKSTYPPSTAFPEGKVDFYNDYWKWKDANENAICWRSDEYEEVATFDCDKRYVDIMELSDAKLTLKSYYKEQDDEELDIDIIYLVPSN